MPAPYSQNAGPSSKRRRLEGHAYIETETLIPVRLLDSIVYFTSFLA